MTVTSHSRDEDFHFVVSSAGPCAALAELFPLLIRFSFFFFLKAKFSLLPTRIRACLKAALVAVSEVHAL